MKRILVKIIKTILILILIFVIFIVLLVIIDDSSNDSSSNNINSYSSKPQECICYKDYVDLVNSINPSHKKVDTATAKTMANALATLPTTDYCPKQISSMIYMHSKLSSLTAEYKDKCGDGFIEGFATGVFEPWKVFTTCPDIKNKYEDLFVKWKQQKDLYYKWYQKNCN